MRSRSYARHSLFALALTLIQPAIADAAVTYRIEIDWFVAGDHSHEPTDCEIAAVKRAFAREGITLEVELSNAISETSGNSVIDFFTPSAFDNGEWAALEAANRNHLAGTGWHYAIFGHNYAYNGVGTTSSGLAERPGDEFLVSLGSFSGGVGTPWDRAALLLHEFGHNLSLRHAGDQNENTVGRYKPNYASVMAYRYTLIGVKRGMECQGLATPPAPFFHLDFSHGTLAQLNENALVETAGIGLGGVDWDCSGGVAGTVVQDVSSDADWCSSTGSRSIITDFDDWGSVVSVALAEAGRSEATDVISCITPEEHTQLLESLAPCIQVDPCAVDLGEREVQYSWSMDADPGWFAEGSWAWGQPVGGGGQHGSPDPTTGYTGSNVYGYDLSGDYPNNLPETHLTSTAIDCTGLSGVSLRFRRWLNVESPTYDHAYVRVSTDGSNWTPVWQNTAEVTDSAWSEAEYDISSLADGEPTVYLRWTMGTTDTSWQYSGWNIDDVEIVAVPEPHPLLALVSGIGLLALLARLRS